MTYTRKYKACDLNDMPEQDCRGPCQTLRKAVYAVGREAGGALTLEALIFARRMKMDAKWERSAVARRINTEACVGPMPEGRIAYQVT